MNERQVIYEMLCDVAKAREVIYYSDIGALVRWNMASPGDRKRLADLLGEISSDEVSSGRPMLSALVVSKEFGVPLEGFFELAKSLGRYDGVDGDKFWAVERDKAYEEWTGM